MTRQFPGTLRVPAWPGCDAGAPYGEGSGCCSKECPCEECSEGGRAVAGPLRIYYRQGTKQAPSKPDCSSPSSYATGRCDTPSGSATSRRRLASTGAACHPAGPGGEGPMEEGRGFPSTDLSLPLSAPPPKGPPTRGYSEAPPLLDGGGAPSRLEQCSAHAQSSQGTSLQEDECGAPHQRPSPSPPLLSGGGGLARSPPSLRARCGGAIGEHPERESVNGRFSSP